jgi:REP-associated tyrosine transposase
MATRHRPQFAGAIYHATVRGVDRQDIVRDDVDREIWVSLLARYVLECKAALHTWCLMTNHAHLLVQTPQPNIADLMQRLNSAYACRFNRRHGRVGHLYQDRYASILIVKESHLYEASRYVVLNPVRAGLCADPAEWRWSSYRATAGIVPPPPWLTTNGLLGHFGRGRYAEFVAEDPPAATLEGLLSAA